MKRIAIIGAGASGLVAMKTCRENGFEPVCFERTDDIGGLWNYSEKVVQGHPSVMKTTVINTSKEMMCFSDFPIPESFPNFMHNTKVQEYFRLYAAHFELLKYVRFNTDILHAKRSDDFKQSGKWILSVKDKNSGDESVEEFDGLMLCTGHHAHKHEPKFKGQDTFKGKIVHSHDYKTHEGYEKKRVVIIGIGNSGGDLAVDLSRVSNQVYLSTRRGSWVFNRINHKGLPTDMIAVRRVVDFVAQVLPYSFINSIVEKGINQRFDHTMYGLKPKHRVMAQHPMINDELPNRIACGAVIIKSDIKEIGENWVEFDDDSRVNDIDVILLGTGYVFGFPYLEEGVINVDHNKVDLYKYVYPPGLEQSTLAVIGGIQPWGAINPIAELQCRWFMTLLKGERTLPSREEMMSDITSTRRMMESRYVESPRHTIQVDFVPYMDELAVQVGCKPDILSLMLSDPRLATQVVFGPCTPYQYRLKGPHSWSGARQAIMTQWDRVYGALKTRKIDENSTKSNSDFFIKALIIIVIALVLYHLMLY